MANPAQLLRLPFDGVDPDFATPPVHCGAGAAVLGKASIGAGLSIGAGAVIRADGHFIRLGDNVFLGDGSTIHIAHNIHPAVVGDHVAVGRNAVVHACTLGNGCVIEDDVVILDGATLEDGVAVAAGSTVFPRSILKSGFVYAGSPAKPAGEITRDELARRAERIRNAAKSTDRDASGAPRAELADDVFIARTAQLSGHVVCAARSSIFFGCRLDASNQTISIGPNANVQDNSVIVAHAVAVGISAETTIGHNVRMQDCQIGARSLIGIGSVIAAGTIVEDDVFLAAGATTSPGQKLRGGQLWGGRPARILGALDDARRRMMETTIAHYCDYAQAYARAQRDFG